MEWVETTGRSVEEAKESALDELGVDEPEAEFDVLDEAKAGLFGRVRREARVRARVRPVPVRPKVDRRRQRKPKRSRAKQGSEESKRERSAPKVEEKPGPGAAAKKGSGGKMETIDLNQQVEVVEEFLHGLVEAFGFDAQVSSESVDEDVVEVRVEGDDLGLLVGPRGQTLTALQELSRTVTQRQLVGTHEGRVRIDVAGYRERRREALSKFTRQVAEDVKDSGARKVLEPMSAADRKVVHDTVNEIDGVSSASEGEEPRRSAVILPD